MSDRRYMLRALALARRSLGKVEPNPLVGCVLVRDGRIVAEGFHQKYGGPHAEVEALRDAVNRGVDPAGCHAYVTLEPCSHHGKTPPCVDALIAAKVRRVSAAMIDPFPQVAGRGVARLRAAGIEVETGLCENEARELNRAYLKRVTTGLPYVIAKWAQTLDGWIALAPSDRASPQTRWISNEQSRACVHELRARLDAVIVGIGTVLADDPLLTPRPRRRLPWHRLPRRVVIDPSLRLPVGARLLQSLPAPLTIAVSRERVVGSSRVNELKSQGVEIIDLPALNDDIRTLDLIPLLRHLASVHGSTNVMIEGGATLLGHAFSQRVIDEALVFIAPKLAGDDGGIPVVRGLKHTMIHEISAHAPHKVKWFADDLMLEYRLR